VGRDEVAQTLHDIAINPTVAKATAAATTGIGFSTAFGMLERGIGFAAAVMGLAVSVAIWRKIKTERREAELRILVLEKRLREFNPSPE